MPLESPVGFLTTLEETVATARRTSGPLEGVFTTPVLLVVAPMEPWVEVTAVRTAVRPQDEDESSVTMMPTLVFRIERRSAGSDGPIHFGRGQGDVVMPFAAMSKTHGQFVEKGGEWFVTDVGSKNGTYVNGEKCTANAVLPLRDKATLRFGDVSARFLLPASFCQDLRRRLTPT
jgi:pSer/pThr/pTyr-binding forkhead associated (FHA) protein